jgi:addiction module RelE/StbE family toxin
MQIRRSKRFDKDFAKLPKKAQQQFIERVKLFVSDMSNPLLRVHPLNGDYQGCYSFNVNADVRVVYEIESDIISLLAVGTHSQLYG